MSIDIIKKTTKPTSWDFWNPDYINRTVFYKMYISEKYSKDMFMTPAKEIIILYDENNKIIKGSFYDGTYNPDKGEDFKIKKKYEDNDFKRRTKKNINRYRGSPKRFKFHNIGLYYKAENSGHAVAVLYDSKTKELEVFQRDSKEVFYEESKPMITNLFKYIYGDDIKIFFNPAFCIATGILANYCAWIHHTMPGDCLLWVYWYLELRMTNKEFTRRQVLNKAMKIFQKDKKNKKYPEKVLICEVLKAYRDFVDDFNKQFIVELGPNRKNIIRINKKKTTPLLIKAGRMLKKYRNIIRHEYIFWIEDPIFDYIYDY
jgi:hypothetical protein